jgi:hypothetical protein
LEEITGVVKAGKEARVFYGLANSAVLLNANQQRKPNGSEDGLSVGTDGEEHVLSWSDDDDEKYGDEEEGDDEIYGDEKEGDGVKEVDEKDGDKVVAFKVTPSEGGSEDGSGGDRADDGDSAAGNDDDDAAHATNSGYLFVEPPHRNKHPPFAGLDAAEEETAAAAAAAAGGGGGAAVDQHSPLLDLKELRALVRDAKQDGKRSSSGSVKSVASASEKESNNEGCGGSGGETMAVAVKVFFTTLDQFSKRVEYITGDSR